MQTQINGKCEKKEEEREAMKKERAGGKVYSGWVHGEISNRNGFGGKICGERIREISDWKTDGEKSRDGGADDGKKREEERAGEKTWKINGRVTRENPR